MWPDTRLIELFDIEVPILLAPMAGPLTAELGIAVAQAGGLGAFACTLLTPDEARRDLHAIRQKTARSFNVNFIVFSPPVPDAEREAAWKRELAPYYAELGVDPTLPSNGAVRRPFDEAFCEVVEEFAPKVVSFHFGLPAQRYVARIKRAGSKIISSATTVAEARWLEERGCDAIIAQGAEAGSHRGTFLGSGVESQAGTFALVPQVVDAVKVPVIAAGGVADARGITAALALGASGVQIGTAFLFCPEARLSPLYRTALLSAQDDSTALTNVFSGRPARAIVNRIMREMGPIAPETPEFPLAANGLTPLAAAAEAKGAIDFSSLWAGQAASLGRVRPAGELVRELAAETLERLRSFHVSAGS